MSLSAQDTKQQTKLGHILVRLELVSQPRGNGKVYVSTKNSNKEIIIFDLLEEYFKH
jgi:hypothetical protein